MRTLCTAVYCDLALAWISLKPKVKDFYLNAKFWALGLFLGMASVCGLMAMIRMRHIQLSDLAVGMVFVFWPMLCAFLYSRFADRIERNGPPFLRHAGEFGLGFIGGWLTPMAALATVNFLNLMFSHSPGGYSNWIALALLPIGLLTEYFRGWRQIYFGMFEVGIGVAIAFGLTSKGFERVDPSQIFGLIAAMLAVARGFKDIREGLEKEKRPVGRAANC